uniref:Uncharacterized protein n=1 Tax=Caenorhabditis tropicalis TaxID=1561998 RepID=A0A1I7U321_9PELO
MAVVDDYSLPPVSEEYVYYNDSSYNHQFYYNHFYPEFQFCNFTPNNIRHLAINESIIIPDIIFPKNICWNNDNVSFIVFHFTATLEKWNQWTSLWKMEGFYVFSNIRIRAKLPLRKIFLHRLL